jgi:hypothetical protein
VVGEAPAEHAAPRGRAVAEDVCGARRHAGKQAVELVPQSVVASARKAADCAAARVAAHSQCLSSRTPCSARDLRLGVGEVGL